MSNEKNTPGWLFDYIGDEQLPSFFLYGKMTPRNEKKQFGFVNLYESKFSNRFLCTWQFFVTFLGWLSDLLKWLSDLQLGDEKVTLNHLVVGCLIVVV